MLRLGTIIFVIPCIVLLFQYGIELSEINECLDWGKAYHYEAGECGDEASYPELSFYQRHPLWVNLLLLSSLVGSVFMTVGMVQKRMGSREPE